MFGKVVQKSIWKVAQKLSIVENIYLLKSLTNSSHTHIKEVMFATKRVCEENRRIFNFPFTKFFSVHLSKSLKCLAMIAEYVTELFSLCESSDWLNQLLFALLSNIIPNNCEDANLSRKYQIIPFTSLVSCILISRQSSRGNIYTQVLFL